MLSRTTLDVPCLNSIDAALLAVCLLIKTKLPSPVVVPTAAIDGVEFSASAGTIDSGIIKMYGLSKS